jgi:hypothetical protein
MEIILLRQTLDLCFSLICGTHDFLNMLCSMKILYLFFVTFQAFLLGYCPLFPIDLILVWSSTARRSHFFHYFLDLFLSIIMGFISSSCLPLSRSFSISQNVLSVSPSLPMPTKLFSCQTSMSSHFYHAEKS